MIGSPTLTGALDAACLAGRERVALTSLHGQMTFGEFGQAVASIAAAYRSLGIGHGDRIVSQLSNRPEHLIVAAAAWRCSAIHVGVDLDLVLPEVLWRLDHTDAKLLVVEIGAGDDDRSAAVRALRAMRPDLMIVVVGEGAPELDCHRFSSLLAHPADEGASTLPSPDDAAVIFFTSGTTSAPKGVVRFHGQLILGWGRVGERLALDLDDVHLGHLPLAHGFGFGVAVTALMTGGRLVLVERFSPEKMLALIASEGVTVFHGTPTHFTLLTDRLDPARHDVRSLRVGIGSAARFQPMLLHKIFDLLGMELRLSYGSSEGLGWSTMDRATMLAGSVGTPPPELIQIVDSEKRPVSATGEVGEIALRRRHAFHYWGQSGAIVDDGAGNWYYTGDIGRIDVAGRLYVLGRVKHQVSRGGIRIDPGEIEELLERTRQFRDCAVVGLPDPVLGEVVCACIVPGEADPPSLHELRTILGLDLARHKLPEELCHLEVIPRTALGKVDREALRERAQAAARREQIGRPVPVEDVP